MRAVLLAVLGGLVATGFAHVATSVAADARATGSVDGLAIRMVLTPFAPSAQNPPCAGETLTGLSLGNRSVEVLRGGAGMSLTREGAGATVGHVGQSLVAYHGSFTIVSGGSSYVVGFGRPENASFTAECSPAPAQQSAAGDVYATTWSKVLCRGTDCSGAGESGTGCVAFKDVSGYVVATALFGRCDTASLPAATANAAPTISSASARRARKGNSVTFTVRACDPDSSGTGKLILAGLPAGGDRLTTFFIDVHQRQGCATYSASRFYRRGTSWTLQAWLEDAVGARSKPVRVRLSP